MSNAQRDLKAYLATESTPVGPDGASESTQSLTFGKSGDIVKNYSHCVSCGGRLHFSHITDFGRCTTQETTRCPECGTMIKKLMHRLH